MGSSKTWIDFIRHGEPVGGAKIRGQSDDPLSDVGWQQMRAAVGQQRPWQVVVSSPLTRCSAFAAEVASQIGAAVQFDTRLKEIGFGEWEGRSHDELTANDPDRLLRFWTDPKAHAPAGAEPVETFAQRVGEAFDDLVNAHRGRRVLVVCHAGVIRMSLCRVLGFSPTQAFRIKVPYAGLTRVQVEHRDSGIVPFLLSHAGLLE